MNGGLLPSLAVSLALTLVLEIGFFLFIGKRNKRDLALVALVNVITNPAVVLLYWLALLYTALPRAATVAALELAAVFCEGRYYKKYGQSFRHPYLFSVSANAFSFGIGFLLQLIIREVSSR